MKPITQNTLFYGDNLPILRQYIPDESVDLIYLDPPFNSKRAYNVLFKKESGEEAEAQITAFEDTWHWDKSAETTYHELVTTTPDHVSKMIGAMREFVGTNQMMAYLVMMAARLVELHRILKPTGSLYLHCDPTASHYLKVILDTIFEAANFRNEIIWRRAGAHNKLSKQYGPIHDVILFYSKTGNFIFHPGKRPHLKSYIVSNFPCSDEHGFYQSNVLTGSGTRTGESGSPWKGYDPTPKGRHWAIPSKLSAELDTDLSHLATQQVLDLLDEKGFILHPKNPGSLPRYKQYLNSSEGVAFQDIWAYQPGTAGLLQGSSQGIDEDVKWLDSETEKLGYPTQKPMALLERIVQASSNPGDVVLDPFCGCGTAVAAAHKLGRQWIGIDITHLSIALQKYRLGNMFPGITFQVIGEPQSLQDAHQLAQDDRFQFQWWALSLIYARPHGGDEGSKKGKKGADKGIDGIITFIDDTTGKPKRVLVQVKSGKVSSRDIRDLVGTLEREKAVMGVFLTLEDPTKEMKTEAVSAGFYASPGWGQNYPKVQILTIKELLAGAKVDMPPTHTTFKQAAKAQAAGPEQGKLFG